MKKILIIGKKSFTGSHLKIKLSKSYHVKSLSINDALKKNILFFKKFTHVINTTIHKSYIFKKYNKKFDFDRLFINKFNKINFIYIFFNTRKIYSPKFNITENSLIKPQDTYAKNKLITERFLLSKIKYNLLSLRISNILGKRLYKDTKKTHDLFLDNFINFRKNNKNITVVNNFKDFITIEQFTKIIKKLVLSNSKGIFNISLSKKIFISELIYWMDKEFYRKIKFLRPSRESFTLSNKKLMKEVKIKLLKKDLILFSKKIFNNTKFE
tara:strand:- start:187 stop:993 length:807 start_codon:yes stop_codon:yes gene_type:complete